MTNVSSLYDVIADLEGYVADCKKAHDDHDEQTIIRCFEAIESLMENALDLHGRFTGSIAEPEILGKDLEEARRVLGLCDHASPELAELVIHEIEAALKCDDVPIRQNALKAYRQLDMSDSIPF